MRKLLSVIAVVLCITGFGSMSPAGAHTAAPSADAKRSVMPYEGPYLGMDAHHRTITFSYTRSRGMYDFRVNHHLIGGAHVSGGQWHHTCHNGYCTRGQWHHDFNVTGHWNNTSGGGDVFFEASAIAF
jgi:hypothetical protein